MATGLEAEMAKLLAGTADIANDSKQFAKDAGAARRAEQKKRAQTYDAKADGGALAQFAKDAAAARKAK